jgi:metal transporter CNNM
MSTPLLVLVVTLLICMSAICSGLNVAIMSLDPGDLKRKARLGNTLAKRVLPFRRNYHLTLASILLVNVAVVSATSLVLESAMNGILAGLLSTLLIVILGEITPQALFSQRALLFCGVLSPVMRIMTIATYPVSKPLQLLLDRTFGHTAHALQSRQELGLVITEHLTDNRSDLDEDEVEIMRGALSLSEKRVREIMTPIAAAYWLTPDTVIDDKQIAEIQTKSWSRIPVFSKNLKKCYGVLLMKDLVNINFSESPIRVDALPLHPTNLVGSMTALDTMFRKFINAHTHLIPVEKDDKIVGIVTIEDLLEEIVGHEIIDEVDHRTHRS